MGASKNKHAAIPSLIPVPAQIKLGQGQCEIGPEVCFTSAPALRSHVDFYASLLRNATGWTVPVNDITQGTPQKNSVVFTQDNNLPREGYQLVVKPDHIQIKASHKDGFFYGFQTLRQLMPYQAFRKSIGKGECVKDSWSIPCVSIQDQPRFLWRGILVDVSRYFQTKEAMMELIDAMALNKLNILHWHLTDDAGWRIEIKAYPKLALDSKQYYTQADIKEVVKYAAQRGVHILPEIDVPGHSWAAVRSYPFLGCRMSNGKLAHVFNPAKETTYQFIDQVFSEVVALFPDAYLHIGGDEVGKDPWKQDPDCVALMKKKGIKNLHDLQTHFVGRVASIAKKHGRRTFIWGDAAGKELGKDISVMSWQGMKAGMEAMKRGQQVVFCPNSTLYFDRANSRSSINPRGWAPKQPNTANLHRVYHFQAAPTFLSPQQQKLVMGAEGCVWGEMVKSKDHMLRLTMLRGCALGETLWKADNTRNWEEFLTRLTYHRKRLDALNIPYFWEPETNGVQVGHWKSSEIKKENTVVTWDVSSQIKRP
jgi:hexosaminidase